MVIILNLQKSIWKRFWRETNDRAVLMARNSRRQASCRKARSRGILREREKSRGVEKVEELRSSVRIFVCGKKIKMRRRGRLRPQEKTSITSSKKTLRPSRFTLPRERWLSPLQGSMFFISEFVGRCPTLLLTAPLALFF